jgi:hypothetical protein
MTRRASLRSNLDAQQQSQGSHMTTRSMTEALKSSEFAKTVLFCAMGLVLSIGSAMTSSASGPKTHAEFGASGESIGD